MVLKIRVSDRETDLNCSVVYDPKPQFVLASNDNSIQLTVPFLNIYKGENDLEEYLVYILYHNAPAENAIFQIYESIIDSRIGWIIPIQALVSTEHSYIDNEHYLRYASAANIKLMKDTTETNETLIPDYAMDRSYLVTDFYPRNAVALVLSKEKLKLLGGFELSNYLPTLHEYGYSKNKKVKKIDFISEETPDKRIALKPISKDIEGNKFIDLLLYEIANENIEPLLRFHLLYQIIELIIERIYRGDLENFIKSPDLITYEAHEVQDKLSKICEKKSRISRVFDGISKSTELIDAGNTFLDCGDQNESMADMIRNIRNQLVHTYHRLEPSKRTELNRVNNEFEPIILEILIKYRYVCSDEHEPAKSIV